MSTLSKLIYIYIVILIKIPASYFVDIKKLILNLTWKSKKVQKANIVLN